MYWKFGISTVFRNQLIFGQQKCQVQLSLINTADQTKVVTKETVMRGVWEMGFNYKNQTKYNFKSKADNKNKYFDRNKSNLKCYSLSFRYTLGQQLW